MQTYTVADLFLESLALVRGPNLKTDKIVHSLITLSP